MKINVLHFTITLSFSFGIINNKEVARKKAETIRYYEEEAEKLAWKRSFVGPWTKAQHDDFMHWEYNNGLW